MFVISKMASIVRIEPKDFQRDLPDALSRVLNTKLANKVLKDVGLVIALFDIIEIGESHVMAGDGASHTKGQVF
jgi:DNA-directed RNA polymerase III subunit RPC8